MEIVVVIAVVLVLVVFFLLKKKSSAPSPGEQAVVAERVAPQPRQEAKPVRAQAEPAAPVAEAPVAVPTPAAEREAPVDEDIGVDEQDDSSESRRSEADGASPPPPPARSGSTPEPATVGRVVELQSLRKGLAKSRNSGGFFGRLKGLLSGQKEIDPDIAAEIEEVLLTSDVGVGTTEVIQERGASLGGAAQRSAPYALGRRQVGRYRARP
jgi:fused signal recognition particle receptor